jgi:hypothetical protein
VAGVAAAKLAQGCADDQIVDPVAVDVAGAGDALACLIEGLVALNDESVAGGKTGQIDIGARRAQLAEDDIGLPGVAAGEVAAGRADNEVVDAVAIDVASRRDACTGKVRRGAALDREAVSGGQAPQIDIGARDPRLAEDDIGLSGKAPAIIIAGSADDQIVDPVAINVSGRRNRARQVQGRIALDEEPVGGREARQVDVSACRTQLAENDVGPARIGAAVDAEGRADDQIVDPVVVDVTDRRRAGACLIIGPIALDDEALSRRQRR